MELSYITIKIVTEQDPEQVEQDIRNALGSKAINISVTFFALPSPIHVETDGEESVYLSRINPQYRNNTIKLIRSMMGCSLTEAKAIYDNVVAGKPFKIKAAFHKEFTALGCSVEIKEN